MRICHITSMHEWDDDRIFQRACKGLSAEGIDVDLIATSGESPDAGEMGAIRFIPLARREGLRRRFLSSFEAYRLALSTPADIFHFHDPDLLPFMWRLKARGRRVVYDIHENYSIRFAQWGVPARVARSLSRVYRWLEDRVISTIDGIVVPAVGMKERVGTRAHESVVVRNMHSIRRVAPLIDGPHIRSGRPVVYTSGSNGPDRNCLSIVRSLPAVRAQFPSVQFRFAGSVRPDGYQETLEKEAEAFGVSGALDFQPQLPYLEHFRRTMEADVGLVLLERNEKNLAATSNRMFEYMMCGIPIVVEDLPEQRQVVDDAECGLLVDSRDVDELAAAITRLLADEKLALRLGANGYQAARQRYNFESDLVGLLAFYDRVLSR